MFLPGRVANIVTSEFLFVPVIFGMPAYCTHSICEYSAQVPTCFTLGV